MPATPESGKMLSICLSDYVVNSLGYVLQKHRMIQYHLTQKDVRTRICIRYPVAFPQTLFHTIYVYAHAVILNSEIVIKPAMYHFRDHVH